jgi:hypothetical protein
MRVETREHRNARIRREIMDLRDQRYRLYKEIARLEDIQLFEPENFSADDQYWLRYHQADVARIKAEEARLLASVR